MKKYLIKDLPKGPVVITKEQLLEIPQGGGTTGESYIAVTKTQLDTYITNSTLKPGVLYGITEAERWMLLGDSTDTLYLRAISTNQLETKGTGKFFVPKYDQTLQGYGIWQGEVYAAFPTTVTEPVYAVDDTVIWGGKLWKNLTGLLGSKIDIYTLSEDWEVIPFDEVNYNVRFDKIEYDYQNDMIIYRKDNNGNEISTSYQDWTIKEYNFGSNLLNYSLWNSLKIYQWGNEFDSNLNKGCGLNIVTNSILECLNTCGNIHSNVLNNGNIHSNVLNNGNIHSNVLEWGYITYNTLENGGYIDSNTLNIGQMSSNTLNSGQMSSNTLNNGIISSNTLNGGLISSNTLDGGNINSNTLDGGQMSSNILNSGQMSSNTLNNGIISSNTLNGGLISSNTLDGGNINSNTLDGGQMSYNTLNSGYITNNTLENSGNISYNTLDGGLISSNTLDGGNINSNTVNNGRIRLGLANTVNNKTIRLLTINNGDIGGVAGINLSSATLVYADYTREVFKNSVGVTKIRYVDGSGTTVIADLTD